jgi:hypothetical protein
LSGIATASGSRSPFAGAAHDQLLGNVEFGLEAIGVSRTERTARARHFLALVGLSGFERRRPYNWRCRAHWPSIAMANILWSSSGLALAILTAVPAGPVIASDRRIREFCEPLLELFRNTAPLRITAGLHPDARYRRDLENRDGALRQHLADPAEHSERGPYSRSVAGQDSAVNQVGFCAPL